MRLTPWLAIFANIGRTKTKARRVKAPAIERLETLEDRALLTPLPGAATTYVDDDWAAYTNGQNITDADPGTDGNQPAVFGTSAFSTIQAAVTAVDAAGKTVVNDGTYNENVTISKAVTLVSVHGRDSTTIAGLQAGGQLGAVVIANGANNVQVGDYDHGFKILGIDGTAAIEKAAVYVQGNHTNLKIIDNELNARGDSAFTAEYGSVIAGMVIDSNTFSGTTFIGTPSGSGSFLDIQFSLNNVPRQLIVMGNGGGAGASLSSGVEFTNNLITGTSGGISNTDAMGNPATPHDYGNQLVTIDVSGAVISGNVFSGTTTGNGTAALRVRRNTSGIVNNTFDTAGMGVDTTSLVVQNTTATVDQILANNLVLVPSTTPGEVVVDRTEGGGDVLFRIVAGVPQVSTDGGTTYINLPDDTESLVINGSDESDDVLTLNFSTGVFTFPITFNGGDGGHDTLNTFGGTFNNGHLTVTNSNSGTIQYNGAGLVTYTGLEPIVDDNVVTNYTIDGSTSADNITIANGTANRTIVSEASVNFEQVEFKNKTNVTIRGLGGKDTFTLNNPNPATGLSSLTILGGGGADTVKVTTAFTLPGDIDFRVENVELSANVTASAITGEATSVKVLTNTVELQDAVDAAALTGGTVSIAAGSYTGSVTTAGKSVTLAPVGTGNVSLSGTLTLTSDDTLAFTLASDSSYSSLTVAGAVTLGGASVLPTLNYAADYGTVFTIINSTTSTTGLINSIPEGGILTVGPTRYIVSYVGGGVGGHNVTLTVARPPVTVSFSNGNLVVTGTTDKDEFTIEVTGLNQVRLIGADGTNFTGAGGNNVAVGPFNVLGNLTVNTGDGTDIVTLTGSGVSAQLVGKVSINLGTGNDQLTQGGIAPLTLQNTLSILGGTGSDSIVLGLNNSATDLVTSTLTVDTGTDDGVVSQSIVLIGVTVNGNTNVTNGGRAVQQLMLGQDAANDFNGNVTITQNNALGSAGNSVGVTNSSISGYLVINNGLTTGANYVSIMNSDVGGLSNATNGNASTSNTVVYTGGSVTGNVTVINGNSGFTNEISADGTTFSGKSISFSNGAAGAMNRITVGPIQPTTFAGAVQATNSSATGANLITLGQGTFNSGVTLNNKLAGAAANLIVIGDQDNVNVVGNLAIFNAASTSVNTVDISRLGTSGLKLGDVSIANGASASINVTFGSRGLSTIGGNLSIRNQTTTGIRTTTIDGTTVNGASGLYLSNAGMGDSLTTIGANTPVTVASAFKMEDGTGVTNLDVRNVVLGSFSFTALGGGQDIIGIGAASGSSAVISGTTRIITGSSADTVTIGTLGSALLQGNVSINLADGNDSLTIGTNTSSPALQTGNFLLDGGNGTDTFRSISTAIPGYTAGPTAPGVTLKTKITRFEIFELDNQPI